MEIWRDIEKYEGLYQVSNQGRVKSLKFGKEKILKSGKDKDGYLKVDLCKDGKKKTCQVHRLVAQAFIDNPSNLEQVNHKDEDKTNNNVSNLEWCSAKYNMNYGTHNERVAKALSKQVNQYSLDDKLIATYPSTMEVERQLGYSNKNISKCCLGKYKQAYKYKWRYAD